MYTIAIDKELLDLARFDDNEASERIRAAQNNKAVVHCHCHQGRGLPAPIKPLRLTPVRRGAEYHLRRDPADGNGHHDDCRHHTFTADRLATLGLSMDALRASDEGELRISLDFGLGAGDDDRDKSVNVVQHRQANGREIQVRSRSSLLGLLHLWWTKAGLNRYDPRDPEPSVGPWERVRKVARHTFPNRMTSLAEHGLSSILLLPINATAEPGEQARRNRAKLFEAHKHRRLMFLCQLDLSLLQSQNAGGFADLYPLFGVGLSLHGDLITQMMGQYPAERAALATNSPVIAFGTAKVRQLEGGRLAATIERIALMGVTNWYVPVESTHERMVAEYLESSGRAYMKPLRHDVNDPVHPDFILLDTAPPTPIEVYGMNTATYLQRKAVKQAYYTASFPGRHWQWDVLQEGFTDAIQRLQPPSRIKGRRA